MTRIVESIAEEIDTCMIDVKECTLGVMKCADMLCWYRIEVLLSPL